MKFFDRFRKGNVGKPASEKEEMQFLVPKGVSWTVDDLYRLEAQGKFGEALEGWKVLLTPFQDPQIVSQVATLKSHRYIWLRIGMCYRRLEMYDEALDAYDKAVALARQAGDGEFLAEALNCIGVVYRNQGKVDEALRQFGDALKAAETIRDFSLVTAVHDNTAMCYRNQGFLEKALTAEKKAQAALASHPSQVSASVQSRVLGNLGSIYAELGRVDEAIPLLEQALNKAREAGDSVQEADIQSNLRSCRGNSG